MPTIWEPRRMLNKKSCATGCSSTLYSELLALYNFSFFFFIKDQKLRTKSPLKPVKCTVH